MSRSSKPILALIVLPGVAVPATAQPQASAQSLFDGGSNRTRVVSPQLPTLLNGYAARPPWKVAGVDYAVGVPADIVLKDPATISMGGVTVDKATGLIRVTGSNVTLNGYDFGLAGGWGIYILSGAENTMIENSTFAVGAHNYVPINAATGAGSLTIQNNTLNGGGGQTGTVWALINYNGSGTFIARYNNLLNAPEDAIDFGGKGPMTTIVEYNLFQNLGTSPGSHADSVQYTGVTASNSVLAFNTIYQPNPGGLEGIQLAAQGGSTLTNTTIDNNVIVAKGPALTMSYSIAVLQSTGNTIDGVVVEDNYIDFSGAYGAFYGLRGEQTTLPAHVIFSNNVNMLNGAIIAAPKGAMASNLMLVTATPAKGTARQGSTLTLVLRLNVAAVVSGIPTLILNTGGRATYVSGSGTDALTFSYQVGAFDTTAAALRIVRLDLPAGSSLRSTEGNRLNLTELARSFPGLFVN
jgi:hypothetical protein